MNTQTDERSDVKDYFVSIKNSWNKKSSLQQIIIITLLIIIFSFYWFEYRPSQIRKECAEVADSKTNVGNPRWDKIYDSCISSKGILK